MFFGEEVQVESALDREEKGKLLFSRRMWVKSDDIGPKDITEEFKRNVEFLNDNTIRRLKIISIIAKIDISTFDRFKLYSLVNLIEK